MNSVQESLANLEGKGWSLAAIADELEVSYNAVQKWKAGDRYPSHDSIVLRSLAELGRRRRVPKKRRPKPQPAKPPPTLFDTIE